MFNYLTRLWIVCIEFILKITAIILPLCYITFILENAEVVTLINNCIIFPEKYKLFVL